MARTASTLTFTIRLPWWTRPFLALALTAARLGLPVDPDRIADVVTRRTRIERPAA